MRKHITPILLLIVTLLLGANFYLDDLERKRTDEIQSLAGQNAAGLMFNGMFQQECVSHVNHLYQKVEETRCRCNENDIENRPVVPYEEPLPKNELPPEESPTGLEQDRPISVKSVNFTKVKPIPVEDRVTDVEKRVAEVEKTLDFSRQQGYFVGRGKMNAGIYVFRVGDLTTPVVQVMDGKEKAANIALLLSPAGEPEMQVAHNGDVKFIDLWKLATIVERYVDNTNEEG